MMHSRPLLHLLTFALCSLVLNACSKTPEDHVRTAAENVSRALLYRDINTLYTLHVESEGQGVFCDDRFRALFQKTRTQTDPKSCKDANAITSMDPAEKKKLDDSLILLSELLHFHCTHPAQADATCPAFARDIFRRKAEQSRFWKTPPADIKITHVQLEHPTKAAAYVDILPGQGSSNERITLHFQKSTLGEWKLTTYPW